MAVTTSGGRMFGQHGSADPRPLPDSDDAREAAADQRLGAHLRQLSRLNPAMSHDIRGPLNTVMLNLEILKESLRGDPASELRERREDCLRVVRHELGRVHTMLETLLIQTRLSESVSKTLDLRGVVRDLEALVQPYAHSRRVTVVVTVPTLEVMVPGNEDDLRRGLLPLLIDALEASPAGSGLLLTLTTVPHGACLELRPPDADQAPESVPFAAPAPLAWPDARALREARDVVEARGGSLDASQGSRGAPCFQIHLPFISRTS